MNDLYTTSNSCFLIRHSIEVVCREAQCLSEGGRGSGEEVAVTGQLQVEHQALLKAARERLYICQESQALGETLQGFWSWLEEIQERLGTVDSTMGTKEQLEQRLETVQVRKQLHKVTVFIVFPGYSSTNMHVFLHLIRSFAFASTFYTLLSL